MIELNPNLDLCDAEDNPRLGNATLLYPLIWRFLPAMDVNVDLYLSRDLDSRISDREVGNEINLHVIGNTIHNINTFSTPNLIKRKLKH